jgi:hypothetical protein
MSIENCLFRDNQSGDDGGAVSLSTGNDELTFLGSDFINNTAVGGNGGALRIYSGNYHATIRNCRYIYIYVTSHGLLLAGYRFSY